MLAFLKAKAKGGDKVFAVQRDTKTEFQFYILSQLDYNFTYLITAGMENADAKVYPHCRP